MCKTIFETIIEKHLIGGKLEAGSEISIKIDQTLTQDATGTLAYLQFESLNVPKVKTELSVSYIDHNTLQTGFENADDHLYLQSIASKYGILLSKAGNGICHQVHLERFGRPGRTLLGSDSHTTTAGGIGMIAIGAGGLDVAVSMAGTPFYLEMPKITGIRLHGELKLGVSAKDVILELLNRFGVKGGVGKVLEYFGDDVNTLTVPERATITNMGTETGATTSIFPSDNQTKKWLQSQQREDEWTQLKSSSEAEYDEIIDVTLDDLVPLVAEPHSPENVRTVSEIAGLKVNQVAIGSCTNSSYRDLMTVANILKDKKVHPDVSLIISPGSRQVLKAISENGVLTDLIFSGARILECTCGPCIGMGQAPPTNGVTLRTFNRNFEGRSGTNNASIYLVSPEVAAASAIEGVLTDPRDYVPFVKTSFPEKFDVDDSLIIKPSLHSDRVKIIRGPNIKQIPINEQLPKNIVGEVLLKVGDNVTTDYIMPAGAKILPLRSNIPMISQYVFNSQDPTFPRRAREKEGGIIVGGENYGQGSSREHAALALMYLGIKAVVAKSFARIHKTNLVNFGVLPLEFINKRDYEKISHDDILEIPKIRERIERGNITIKNRTKNLTMNSRCDFSPRFKKIVLAGGLMNMIKNSQSTKHTSLFS